MNAVTPDLNLTPITTALRNIRSSPNRLLFLVGPPGSGKTRHMMALQATHGYPRVALGAPVAEGLRSVLPKRRPARVRELVTDVLAQASAREVVLVDNIEVLFLPDLSTDPLGLFKDLSRNRTLCVAWPGRLEEDGSLLYAELGHPEHVRFRNHGVHCIRMPGTA